MKPPARKSKPKAKSAAKSKRRTRYHHGNLRAALVEATLALIEEAGTEQVTVRAAAKRAGVSSGAPFRHFPSRTALMTAVAEEAQRRFRAEIDAALAVVGAGDPLARFRALGIAYLRWVRRNPTHFQVISSRGLIDYDSSDYLRRDNDEIRATMETMMAEALAQGRLRSPDLAHLKLASRALVYGLGRMLIDGHFAQWGISGETPEQAMEATVDLFLTLASTGAV